MISVGASEVVNGPSNSSPRAMVRVPSGPRATTSASMASRAEPQSPWGSAWASDPQTVPRLRMIGSEMSGAAAPRVPHRPPPSRSDRSQVLWRTRAPTRRSPSSSARVSRPGRRLMSTSTRGAANRSFMSGMRLIPPASTLASSSYRPRVSSASSNVAGTTYSKLAGYRGDRPSVARRWVPQRKEHSRQPGSGGPPLANDALAHGPAELAPVGRPGAREHPAQVGGDGTDAERHGLGDLPVGPAVGHIPGQEGLGLGEGTGGPAALTGYRDAAGAQLGRRPPPPPLGTGRPERGEGGSQVLGRRLVQAGELKPCQGGLHGQAVRRMVATGWMAPPSSAWMSSASAVMARAWMSCP